MPKRQISTSSCGARQKLLLEDRWSPSVAVLTGGFWIGRAPPTPQARRPIKAERPPDVNSASYS